MHYTWMPSLLLSELSLEYRAHRCKTVEMGASRYPSQERLDADDKYNSDHLATLPVHHDDLASI